MSEDIRVVKALGKLAIVQGMTPIVGPITGDIDDLEKEARKLKGQAREDALIAIDIYKSKK